MLEARLVTVSGTREYEVVVVVVTNTGRGISREALPHIFEPFRQTGPHVAGAEGGLGLGLSIAKHIVELHSGTICATSDGTDRGASFVVRLPAIRLGVGGEPKAITHDARS